MRVGVPIALVNDERDEEPERGRVCPQFSPQETGDQENLDQAVNDKVSAGESRGVGGKVLDSAADGNGNPIVGIFE